MTSKAEAARTAATSHTAFSSYMVQGAPTSRESIGAPCCAARHQAQEGGRI